jgi:hypothetical protein
LVGSLFQGILPYYNLFVGVKKVIDCRQNLKWVLLVHVLFRLPGTPEVRANFDLGHLMTGPVDTRKTIELKFGHYKRANRVIKVIDLVLIDPQSVGKRTHDLMNTVNAKKRWKTIYWRVNYYLK